LYHGRHERTIRYADTCNQSSLRRVAVDERFRWRNRLLHVADRSIIHRSPPLLYAAFALVVLNRLAHSSAFSATSRQPASTVSACPRPGILPISVPPLLRFCFLYDALAIAQGSRMIRVCRDDQHWTPLRVRRVDLCL